MTPSRPPGPNEVAQPDIPDVDPRVFVLATQAHRAGRGSEAARLCHEILEVQPRHAGALHLLAILATEQGDYGSAAELLARAIDAVPGNAVAHCNLGNVLQQLGRLDAAVASYDRAIALRGDFVQAWSNRGAALRKLQRFDAAVASLDRAIALDPDYAPAHVNRGIALSELVSVEAALASFDRAIQLRPDSAEAHFNRGNALVELRRPEEALESYDRAIALKPAFPKAYFNRGGALEDMLRLDEAKASYEAALRLDPDYAGARWALAFLTIPPLPIRDESPESAALAFAGELQRLEDWFAPERRRKGGIVVGTHQPFYLAYREVECRDVLARYGKLCHRLMEPWQQSSGFRPEATRVPGPLRVGFVSRHIREHSVWNAIIRGWLLGIDPQRFLLFVYHLGTACDAQTELARATAYRFVEGPRSLEQWSKAIVADRLDALIYPDIAMNALSAQLANLRLAAVQMAAWGHPQTTGFPTIDYYLSGADFEPADAQQSYVEALVALPNLGCSCARQAVTPVAPNLSVLGLESDVPLLLCPGNPFKYAPEHDWIFPEIARAAPRCQLVFFESKHRWMSAALRQRLVRVFAQAGLDFDAHAAFIPWLGMEEFYGLMCRADAFLDTIGFSGFNTAMQAVECCLPIVTHEGRFMRGRLASGILTRMGMRDLVAHSHAEYVALAVRLIRDGAHRDAVRGRMRDRQAVLFDDPAPIRALEAVLSRVCHAQ